MAMNKDELLKLFGAKRYLGQGFEDSVGLRFHVDTYMQDPMVAEKYPEIGFDEDLMVDWEPGLANGPTSARFAVVDFNGDAEKLLTPAKWRAEDHCFYDEMGKLDKNNCTSMQFHQVNVWATLQRALAFFEDGLALGRSIPWGFEGNRLIVVPHAGYGQNAFYDRTSKSLQFYYFESEEKTIYTCLSADIINHEFGHAVLDGIRPLFMETISVETGAFHEFMGDFTAILLLLRNNKFRGQLNEMTNGNLEDADLLANLAEQFGVAVTGKDFLRTAKSELTMDDVRNDTRPHHYSQVMTGAMFEILMEISENYRGARKKSPLQAFYYTIFRMQRMAFQPLDFLPPVDVTFRDYAKAVLQAERVANPTDPYQYRPLMMEVFRKRGILSQEEIDELNDQKYIFEPRLDPDVFHGVEEIGSSREAAYHFLNDNRAELFIPAHQDLIVTDVYQVHKKNRENLPLPRQTVVVYVWREDVLLDGPQFGNYQGKSTTMWCGGTLVFDDGGNLLHWARKPGTELPDEKKWEEENEKGQERRGGFLEAIGKRIKRGQVGGLVDSEYGFIGSKIPPFVAHTSGSSVRFELSPHFHIKDEDPVAIGGRKWQISS